MKNRDKIKRILIDTLMEHKPVYIGIFGSFSRSDFNENSDIDVLVKFRNPHSLLKLIRIENELKDNLNMNVDLVTEGALTNKRIKKSITNDLQFLYKA